MESICGSSFKLAIGLFHWPSPLARTQWIALRQVGTGSGPTLEFYAQVAESLRTAQKNGTRPLCVW